MPWMVPEARLDPNQRDFLQAYDRNSDKNYWVKGFAGSGKSVLVVHAAIRALQDNPGLKICIVLFTHSLIDLFRTGLPEDLPDIPVMTYYRFKKHTQQYDLILVDEVQDLPADVLSKLKAHSKRLIVAGDEAQSIYDNRVAPEEIEQLADAEPYTLTILHRLTQKIIDVASNIFPDKQLDKAKKSRLKNVEVVVAEAEESDDEVAYVWENAVQNAVPGKPVPVLLPKRGLITQFANQVLAREGKPSWNPTLNTYGKTDFGAMNAHLERQEVRLQYIGNSYGSLATTEQTGYVVLMTYHSAKGLDFETVFLPFLTDSLTIWRSDEARARTLFYVALTRSRLNLFLTHTGHPHRFVRDIPDRLVRKMSVPLPRVDQQTTSEEDILF